MLARRLTAQKTTATTCVRFEPKMFLQMAGLAAYYNNHLFHYLYLSHDEEKGRCLQVHSCDDGKSSFPLGPDVISVPEGDLYLRAEFDNSDLRFSWSGDGEIFSTLSPTLDASILSDDHGDHWGFTGIFVALACQDLTGAHLPAEFDFLELRNH